jgi:dolichol kinase
VTVLAAGCAVALALELARARHGATRVVFTRVTGPLLRLHEHERWSGATWLLLAFLGATLVAPREVAISAMWAIAVGDAAAAMVGRAVARRTTRRVETAGVHPAGKTLAGSAACFALTLAGALVVARVTVAEGLIAAAAAAAAEWPSTRLDDNLRIAAAVVGGILLWRIMFS